MTIDRRHFITTTAFAGGWLATNTSLFAKEMEGGTFQLPALPYAESALEPYIDARTMGIHHGKHHAGYTRKLNAALEKLPDLQGASIENILGKLSSISDPSALSSLRNNGGGYFNHRLFWEVMAPENETGKASSSLSKAIDQQFGSVKQLQEAMSKAAATQFGSGWGWLSVREGKLIVTSTPNQDNPLMKGLVPDNEMGIPILGVDVWEHAYYLKYQNKRTEYLQAWWKVVNWDHVSQNYDRALAKG